MNMSNDSTQAIEAIFFDLGDTLGTAIIAASKYAKKKGMASAEHTKYGLGIGFGIATAALVSTGSTSGSYAPYVAGIGAIAGAVASHKFGSFTKAIGKYG